MDQINHVRIPKKAFDSEYTTDYLREVRFLTEKGIQYTFAKETPEYGVVKYKYRKTPALFTALVEFYAKVEAERNLKRRYAQKEETPLSAEEIKKAQEILEKAAKQIQSAETHEDKDDTI